MQVSFLHSLTGFLMVVLMASCMESRPPEETKQAVNPEESLIKVNRYLIKKEKTDIDNYIRRHGWKMQESGSGLRYQIYDDIAGNKAVTGKIATIEYKIWLLSGDLVYSSEELGPKTFRIGHGGVESGLEEGILLMSPGDKARFILASHLAYGLLGDDKKIPPKMPIVYQVELIELQ